jgi:hypothetical protein
MQHVERGGRVERTQAWEGSAGAMWAVWGVRGGGLR